MSSVYYGSAKTGHRKGSQVLDPRITGGFFIYSKVWQDSGKWDDREILHFRWLAHSLNPCRFLEHPLGAAVPLLRALILGSPAFKVSGMRLGGGKGFTMHHAAL